MNFSEIHNIYTQLKKGDLSLSDNYRGIMLLEAAYKIAAILLLNRLQPIAESLDQEQQCGFQCSNCNQKEERALFRAMDSFPRSSQGFRQSP